MAWRCGSLPRTLVSTARASSSPFRSSPALSRPLRPPPVPGTRIQSRRFSFTSPRYLTGPLGSALLGAQLVLVKLRGEACFGETSGSVPGELE